MHGKQSTLLSSALEKSKTINATKAVTCKKKSNKTAKANNRKDKRKSAINLETYMTKKNITLCLSKLKRKPTRKHREDSASRHRNEASNCECQNLG